MLTINKIPAPLVTFLLLLTVACGGRDPSTTLTIAKDVTIPLKSGVLTIYDFSNGKKSNILGTLEFTNSTASLQIDGFKGNLFVEVTRATYRDPVLNEEIRFDEKDSWAAIVPDFGGKQSDINVNPITTLAANYTLHLIQNVGIDPTTAIIRANKEVGEHFGIADIITGTSAHLDSAVNFADEGVKYGLILTGLAMVAVENGGEKGENLLTLTRALVKDLQDGTLDSAHKGETIVFGGTFLQHSFIAEALAQGITDYLDDPGLNNTGLKSSSVSDLVRALETHNSTFFIEVTNVSSDNVPPTIIIQGFESGVFVSGLVEITVDAVDNLSGVQSLTGKFAGSALVDDDPNPAKLVTRINSTQFLEGSYVLELKAADAVGNLKTDDVVVIVDNAFPANEIRINNQILVDGDYTGGAFDLKVNVDNEPFLKSLSVTTDNTVINSLLVDTDPNPSRFKATIDAISHLQLEDTLEVSVVAEDAAGNISRNDLLLNIDNRGPVHTFLNPQPSQYVEGAVSLAIAVTNRFGIRSGSVSLQRNGAVLQNLVDSTPVDGFDLFTTLFDSVAFTNQWGDGDVDLVIQTTDAVGIAKTEQVTFNVNNILQTQWLSMHQMHPSVPDEGMGDYLAVGDFNGDGIGDFAGLGQWRNLQGNPVDERLYVFWGPSFTSKSGDLIGVQLPSPRNEWNTFRTFLTLDPVFDPNPITACDMDGDHKSELIVARPQKEAFTIGFGLQPASGTFDELKIINSPDFQNTEGFGMRLFCKDMNNDGYDDVIVDTSDAGTSTNFNRAWIIYGNSNRDNIKKENSLLLQYQSYPANPTYKFFKLKPIGDLDGDGNQDLIANHNWYNFRIFYGPFNPGYAPSGSNTSSLLSFGTTGMFDMKELYPLGDLEGDGRDNFAVVHSHEDIKIGSVTYNDLGKVWIVNGSADRPTGVGSSFELIVPDSRQYSTFSLNFGSGGVIPGDFNGDKILDFIIGVPFWQVPNFGNVGTVVLYKGPNYTASANQTVLNVQDWYAIGTGAECAFRIGAVDTNRDNRHDMIFGCQTFHDGTFIVARDTK